MGVREERKIMRGLRFCCKGADVYLETELKEESVPEKTGLYYKAKDASVFPAKRKSVKKMICKCFVHCVCGKCMKTKIVSPSTPAESNSNGSYSVCSCSPPHPI